MRHKRTLSQRERTWVGEGITQLCLGLSLHPGDGDYRATAWCAFMELYRSYHPLYDPDFWPQAYDRMDLALQMEKRARNEYLYRLISLELPAAPESGETLLARLPSGHGDFTNGVSFGDFLDHLPEHLRKLAFCLIARDSLEEARSRLGWTDDEMYCAIEILRRELSLYETV